MSEASGNIIKVRGVLAEKIHAMHHYDNGVDDQSWGLRFCAAMEMITRASYPLEFFAAMRDHSVAPGVITGMVEVFCEESEYAEHQSAQLMTKFKETRVGFEQALDETEQLLFLSVINACKSCVNLATAARGRIKPRLFKSFTEQDVYKGLYSDAFHGGSNQVAAILDVAATARETLYQIERSPTDEQYGEFLETWVRPRISEFIVEAWRGLHDGGGNFV